MCAYSPLVLLLLLLLGRFELEQERKWVVEWQVGQKELVVAVADPKQSVYIYNCSDCVVQVGAAEPQPVLSLCPPRSCSQSRSQIALQTPSRACTVTPAATAWCRWGQQQAQGSSVAAFHVAEACGVEMYNINCLLVYTFRI
jgi:hypothetical protein